MRARAVFLASVAAIVVLLLLPAIAQTGAIVATPTQTLILTSVQHTWGQTVYSVALPLVLSRSAPVIHWPTPTATSTALPGPTYTRVPTGTLTPTPTCTPPAMSTWVEQVSGCTVTVNGVVAMGCPSGVPLHWTWGDGLTSDSWFPATHAYASNGTYVVSTTATDSLGQSTTRTVTVTIESCMEPTPSPTLPPGVQPAVLLLVDTMVAPALGPPYQAFKGDLASQGLAVLENLVSDQITPPDVKGLIHAAWMDPAYRLKGAILIGDIPAAYGIMHTGDYSNPAAWTVWLSLDAADMYYGDLDGQWDPITPTVLDSFVANPPPNVVSLNLYQSCTTFRNEYLVTLDRAHEWDPWMIANHDQYAMEIWIARVMGHNLEIPGQTEADILNEYFAMDHAFRSGARTVQDRALILNEGADDYNDQNMNYTGIFSETVKDKGVSPATYLSYLQDPAGSRLLYMTAHSWPKGHALHGGSLTVDQLMASANNITFFVLNACSACRWDEYKTTPDEPNYLGGAYVFNRGPMGNNVGLGAIGFTGVGGFNNLEYFTDYYHDHPGATYGDMYLYWHNRNLQINFGPNDYVYLGDPTLGPDTAR
jgi:PKD repeat protein